MDLGGVLIFLGQTFFHAAIRKIAEAVIDRLIKKYRLFLVAKSTDGASWSYGAQYRKGATPAAEPKTGVDYGMLGVLLIGASQYPKMEGLDNEFLRSLRCAYKANTYS